MFLFRFFFSIFTLFITDLIIIMLIFIEFLIFSLIILLQCFRVCVVVCGKGVKGGGVRLCGLLFEWLIVSWLNFSFESNISYGKFPMNDVCFCSFFF